MNLVIFKTFDNPIAAHNLKNRLEVEEIASYIFDEHTIGLNPLYSNALGGIKVKIAKQDLAKAQLVLDAIESNSYLEQSEELLHCPNCNSTNINTDYRDFKNLKGIVSFIVSIALMVYPIYFKRKCKCDDCNLEFNKDASI